MTPGPIRNANRVLGAPESWDEASFGECLPLPVRDQGATLESAWYPTEEEKQAIAAGRPVILTVWGRSHPPVALGVAEDGA